MEEIIQAVSTVGFPIAVSIYLLLRIDPAMKELAASLRDLRAYMEGRDSHG